MVKAKRGLVALACSAPPEGGRCWTLQLLADRLVSLGWVNELKPWQRQEWCIPPEANAEFVCALDDVLEVYKRPYDLTHPLVGMDKSSQQLVKEVREPLPSEPRRFPRSETLQHCVIRFPSFCSENRKICR
jgi:hypothetical protein